MRRVFWCLRTVGCGCGIRAAKRPAMRQELDHSSQPVEYKRLNQTCRSGGQLGYRTSAICEIRGRWCVSFFKLQSEDFTVKTEFLFFDNFVKNPEGIKILRNNSA